MKASALCVWLVSVIVLTTAVAVAVAAQQHSPSWVRYYQGWSNGSDTATAMATDSNGEIYITGAATTFGFSNGVYGFDEDFRTVRYNSAGYVTETYHYTGLDDLDDSASDVLVGPDGSVYHVGEVDTLASGKDLATTKHTANGTLLWAVEFDGGADDDDNSRGLGIDDTGNVYVATARNAGFDHVSTVIKYDALGNLLWTETLADISVVDLVVSAAGDVHIAGTDHATSLGLSSAMVTYQYNTNGVLQWSQGYHPDYAAGNASASKIALDNDGNTITVGRGTNDIAETDWMMAKYSPDGLELWTVEGGNGGDTVNDMVIDSAGTVYITGAQRAGITHQFFVTKLLADSSIGWTHLLNDFAQGHGDALLVSASGRVYATGMTCEGLFCLSGSAMTTIALRPDGTRSWTALDEDAVASDIVLSGAYVYAGGTSDEDYMVAKYRAIPLIILPPQRTPILQRGLELELQPDAVSLELERHP